MGSSMKKKKDKKKDFQKPKLKVGKTKAKADNFTDTSFKSRSIVLNQQSLTTAAPSSSSLFTHYVSLASTSKSDTQRRDALSYLITHFSSQPVDAPTPTATLLKKLLPLILDGSSSVRRQLLSFLKILPTSDIGDRAESILLYTRAGMTHLSPEIRVDALAVLEWLLGAAKEQTITCPGGWVKTLKCFMAMMGWATDIKTTKWTSASKSSFGKAGKEFPRQLLVLGQFLKAGLEQGFCPPASPRQPKFPLTDVQLHMIPRRANAFGHLNLFGQPRDEDGEMYLDRESRQRVYGRLFENAVETGISSAKKEAGEAGRAAAVLTKVLKENMEEYDGANDTQWPVFNCYAF